MPPMTSHTHSFDRRRLLCCGALAATGLFTSLSARAQASAEVSSTPWINPCLSPLPERLAKHELVAAAFEGLDAAALWDVHAHLLGTGDSGSGCSVHASMHQWWKPLAYVRQLGVKRDPAQRQWRSAFRAFAWALSTLGKIGPAIE